MATLEHRKFSYVPAQGKIYRYMPSLTYKMLARVLGLTLEELGKFRARGFILAPTDKWGDIPYWNRIEVIDWLKAGGPSRAEWKAMKRSKKTFDNGRLNHGNS